MKLLRGLIGLFQDSPTYGRDKANLLSGFTIGTAALLLNIAVLIMVGPLMIDPDDPDFRVITQNVEFGQLLSLILLGGATALATLVIPFRLITVFWGPRIGRYFDQIVLSGITPLRFVIGKVTSQNLFLALVLFLLLPYLVLSITLGGMDFPTFIAGVFLVWLYCMMLALLTLWATLYLNDLIAAVFAIGAASLLIGLGCIPYTPHPFVFTPLPALLHPLYGSIPELAGFITWKFSETFLFCSAGMTTLCAVALFGIYLGPLYGIIRENSTFGEVVRPGDSRKKRWLRLRQHIQRPSEMAFFYENRSDTFRRWEGLIRWGLGFGGLVALAGGCRILFAWMLTGILTRPAGANSWFAYEFHVSNLVMYGISILLAVFLFSHAKNTVFIKIPVCLGRAAQVSRLDTLAFISFLLFSLAATIGMPLYFEHYISGPAGFTLFPDALPNRRGPSEVDFMRVMLEGTAVITVCGIVLYAIHRTMCLGTWLRTSAVVASASLYFVFVCLVPMAFAAFYFEFPEWRNTLHFGEWGPLAAVASPITAFGIIFKEVGRNFPVDTTLPFYAGHGLILIVTLFAAFRQTRQLRKQYIEEPQQEKGQ